MGATLVILAIISYLIAVFYFAVIFPIVAVVNVAGRKEFSELKKGGWIVGVVLTGPVAAFAYTFLTPVPRHYKIQSCFGIAAFVALVIGGTWGGSFLKIQSIQKIENFQTLYPNATTQLSADQKILFSENLEQMKSYFEQTRWYQFTNWSKTLSLFSLLENVSKDGLITQEEYLDWVGKVQAFEQLDQQELRDYVEHKKRSAGASK